MCCHSTENDQWAVKTRISIVYLQHKFERLNDCLTPTHVFLAGVELKKIKFLGS